MSLANKAQEAMNEKPNDGKEGEDKGSDLSDSDQEGKQNELNLSQKVDAMFEAAGTKSDGKLDMKEHKPMLSKMAADLLGIDEGESVEAATKKIYDEIEANQGGKVTKDELLEYLK